MELPRLCTTRLFDQNFGMCISPQDILVPFFKNNATNYYRPWKLCDEVAEKDFGSTIDNAKDKLKITLDVQHFLPNEISVKVNDKEIIIEGKHEEKKDEHGFISRQFMRRYTLPKDCLSDSISSTLSSDGLLSIMVNKKTVKEIKQDEKVIPIKMDGPCRKIETTEKDKCDMKKDKCEMKNEKCDIQKDKCEIKKNSEQKTECAMKDEKIKTENQILKEEHSRLLKPELLGEAVSSGNTEKLLSESRKETDELLKLMSQVQSMPKPTGEKLDMAIGQCKAAMKELAKEKETALSGMASMASAGMSMASEMTSMMSAETSSMKSTMTSESMQTTMSSSTKTSSEKTSDIVSEIIRAELKEAAAEFT